MATCQTCTPTLSCPLHPPRQIRYYHVEPTDTPETREAMMQFALFFWRMRDQQMSADHREIWFQRNPPAPFKSARLLTWAAPEPPFGRS